MKKELKKKIDAQASRVLAYLKTHRNVSSSHIVYKMGIPRASAIIYVLKKRGYDIVNRSPRGDVAVYELNPE